MKKIILFSIVLFALGMVSCSSDAKEVEVNPDPEPDEIVTAEMSLTVSKNIIDLFEMTDIRIHFDKSGKYDSVKWVIPDILEHTSVPNSFLISMGHAFKNDGIYTAEVQVYYEDEIVSRNSVDINVRKELNDFLGVSWDKEIEERFPARINSKKEDWTLSVTNKDHLYATLIRTEDFKAMQWQSDEYYDFIAESRFKLYDYIKSYYHDPLYAYDGEDPSQSPLRQQYQEMFKTNVLKYHPLAIWETSTSVIALMGYKDAESRFEDYKVIAEPRNK